MQKPGKHSGLGGQTPSGSPDVDPGYGDDTAPRTLIVSDAAPKTLIVSDAVPKTLIVSDAVPKTLIVDEAVPRTLIVSDTAPKTVRMSDVASEPASELEPAPRSLDDLSGPPPTDRRLHPLDASLLGVLHQCFSEHAGPDSRIDASELGRSLGMQNEFLAERVLSFFDRDGNGVVTRAEFLDRVRRLVFGSVNDKLRFAFRIHDLNSDNVIERSELLRMITACMAEERTLDSPKAAERLTDLLLKAADRNKDGSLSYREFEQVVLRHPEILELITKSEACWIAPNEDLFEHLADQRPWSERFRRLLQNRWASIACVTLWLSINAALIAHAVLKYHGLGANGFVMVARGAGAALNFNGALILIPVMRRLLTRVRRTPVLRALPVDDALAFHRLVGHSMFALALVHTSAHLANYQFASAGIARGLFHTSAGLTGFFLLLVFGWMWFCSRPTLRRSGRFELFYFSHLLYLAWFGLLLAHGPVFYLWAAVPLFAFGFEQVLRVARRARRTEIVAAQPLRSGVTRLEIERPPHFDHSAGDYAFLRIPALAPHEWHPFTISSAPERNRLTMHVRSLGNFTGKLRELAESRQREGIDEPIAAYLDGPYGTASGHIFEAKPAVLVGAGIGVTPFASVLESIVLRAQQGTTQLKKVHFFWLNRDAYSFEWFLALLTRLEQLDAQRLVDIHIFLTGGRGHLSAAALNLARQIAHEHGQPDLITGLKAKTHVGRPDWSAELQKIANSGAPDPVHVFFCGPPGLGRELRQVSEKLGLKFRQEHF